MKITLAVACLLGIVSAQDMFLKEDNTVNEVKDDKTILTEDVTEDKDSGDTPASDPSSGDKPASGGDTPADPSKPASGGDTPADPSKPASGGDTPDDPSKPASGGDDPDKPVDPKDDPDPTPPDLPPNEYEKEPDPLPKIVLSDLIKDITQTGNDDFDDFKAQVSWNKFKKCTKSINRLHNVVKTDAMWQQYSKVVEGKESLFSDPDFRNEHQSLLWELEPNFLMKSIYEKVSEWRRPKEILENMEAEKKVPELWGFDQKTNYMSGIVQGRLGDCYMLASASALGGIPGRIEKMFPGQTKYNSNGIFKINLWSMGEETSVVIDDNLPMNPDNDKETVNSRHSIDHAWWGPLLEKAYSKMNVGYGTIDGGDGLRAFRDLTGMPTFTYDVEKNKDDAEKAKAFQDKFKADISKYVEKNYPMVTACIIPDLPKGEHFKMGLRNSHMYTLIDTVDLKDGEGKDVTVVKLRNPYGKDEYDGPWKLSDKEVWTDENKIEADYENALHGVFYVPFDVFTANFLEYTVNEYSEKWLTDPNQNPLTIYTKDHSDDDQKQYKLTSRDDQDVIITFDWQNKYQYPKTCQPTVPKLNIIIADEDNGQFAKISQWNEHGHAYYRWDGGFKSSDTWIITITDANSVGNHKVNIKVWAEKSALTLDPNNV